MGVRAYEGVSQQAANVAAQQMIAEGVRDNGLGDGGGMLFGMNLANALNPQNAATVQGAGAPEVPNATAAPKPSLDEQMETLKKLKDLLDMGILTQEELPGASKVLSAAALTYVASLLISLLYFLRFAMIFLSLLRRR